MSKLTGKQLVERVIRKYEGDREEMVLAGKVGWRRAKRLWRKEYGGRYKFETYALSFIKSEVEKVSISDG